MAEEKLDLVSREQALRVARMLGCQGAHETEKGWMPCGSYEEYEAIKKGKEEYLKVLASKKKKPLPKIVQRTKRLETKSDAYYENRADAVAISKARGCGGVRTVLLAGRKYYAVCDHKAPKRGWENLDEKPITGIATLPGGGLVTGSFSGKALGTSVGRQIGGVSEIDGDGDGFTSNARGEDKIPVIARTVLEQIKKIGPEGVEMQLAQRVKGISSTLDDQDFSEVVALDPNRRQKIVSQYDRMPVLDEKAKKAYDQFAGELDRQFKFLEEQGIKFEFVDDDPYKSFYEMHADFIRNRRLKVMKTSVTGSHPYWSDATNDKFRAVHDVLGHLATGRGFDRHGEEAAYQAHKLTLPAEVHGALAMETRGQNAFLIERGDFPPQKAGVLPDDMIKKIFDALHTKQDKPITSDDDNLFEIGGSHHVSGGRHFPKNKMKQKGFVNFVSRSTDPDTFSNPESARIRSRNLGCIGIRRYTARDGKLVWMPCTNVSDYNRRTGIRGDNSPRNNPRRRGSKFRKKVLGTPIGAKPSDELVDGDGDGMSTGGIVGGKDNIPVVPTQILEHAGSPYLKNFEKQKSDLEKKFGDLRNVKNATKAFKKTFPRLKSFDLFDEEGENFSSEYTFARAVALLHLAQDKRIADTISDIGFIGGDDPIFKNTTALCAVGLIGDDGKFFISHAIHFNKSLKSAPESGGGRVYNGWGDEIVKQMREQKVPQSEIDKFWSMYVVNHEWTHAEHNVAMFEQHDLKLDAEIYDMARFAFPDLSDDAFDARVKTAVELAKKGKGTNWGLLVSDEERRQQVLQEIVIRNKRTLESQLAKGYLNDLQKGEVSQLGGNYPLTVSGYAAENFNELVAEKGSAYRMGNSAGSPNNPAWRKVLKFVRGGVEIESNIPNREGMSRQERRALERAQAKLKKNLENLPFGIDWGKIKPTSLQSLPKRNGFISIFGQCEGFTYYLKDDQDGSKNKTKTLYEPISKGMSEGIVLFKGVPKARKKPPTVTSTDINNLAVKVRQHNAKAKPAQRANLRDLKNVYLRGLQDGDKTSANKRVSKFLSLLMSDKPKDVKYFDDNDLLPLDHPWRNRKTTKKWAGFDDGEYGVKYAEKCCPQVVKRYHAK